MRTLLGLLGTLAAVWVVYAVVTFMLQRQIMYPGRDIPAPVAPDPSKLGARVHWLETSEGRVESWFFAAEPEAKASPAVIIAHGNAELIDFCVVLAQGFARLGVGALLVEYPGYGRSEGAPSQPAITEAFVAAYDDLVGLPGVDRDRIVVYGRSLGGGAACALAEERPVAAILLQSAFTSTAAMAAGMMLPGFLVRDPYDNLSTVARFEGPVLVLHGERDEIVPYHHGQALAAAAERSRLVTYDCSHNDFPQTGKVFLGDVEGFLREHAILR